MRNLLALALGLHAVLDVHAVVLEVALGHVGVEGHEQGHEGQGEDQPPVDQFVESRLGEFLSMNSF